MIRARVTLINRTIQNFYSGLIVVDNKKRSQKTHDYWKGRKECLFADKMITKESAEELQELIRDFRSA